MKSHHTLRSQSLSADPDAAVRATNDDAFVTKHCAMRVGYFKDPYLEVLAAHLLIQRRIPKRPPLINRGTAARVMFKNALVDAFLANVCEGRGVAQIVSLGAGYDSLPFALIKRMQQSNDLALHFVEIDLDPVTRSKADVVKSEPLLRDVFKELQSVEAGLQCIAAGHPTSRYSLIPFDLRETSRLPEVLHSAGMQRDRPTLILAEIVLVYLEPITSDALIRVAGEHFSGPRVFVNIEHVEPNDVFGMQMVRNIAARGSPLLGIDKYPTLSAQESRFLREGWSHVEALSMLNAFRRKFSLDESIRLNRIEFLDEVEEWNMLMEHYGIVVAVDGFGDTGKRVLASVLQDSFGKGDESRTTGEPGT